MITDTDIKKLKTVFATKEDLKRFATKEDLDESDARTAFGFTDIQKQINGVQKQVNDLSRQIEAQSDKYVTKDEFVTFEDHILGEIKKLFDENLVRSEHRREIDDHEKRITKLENLAFSN